MYDKSVNLNEYIFVVNLSDDPVSFRLSREVPLNKTEMASGALNYSVKVVILSLLSLSLLV